MRFYLQPLFLLFSPFFNAVSSQPQFTAVQVNAVLPTARRFTAATFDGFDSVYIFGGFGSGPGALDQVLQYSISSDTIKVVASLPKRTDGGTALSDKYGNVYYHGGYNSGYSAEIYKFSPNTDIVLNVGNLPRANLYSAAVEDVGNPDNVYIFGGQLDTTAIIGFNTANLTTSRVGSLPRGCAYAAGVSDGNGSAIIFGNPSGTLPEFFSVTKVNISTLQSTLGPQTFPRIIYPTTAVWDGNYAYVIGGYDGPSQGIQSDSIIQLNPKNLENMVIHVNNFPVSGNMMFVGTSAVFVSSLNRIYFFGGWSYDFTTYYGVDYDGIWYIDLS